MSCDFPAQSPRALFVGSEMAVHSSTYSFFSDVERTASPLEDESKISMSQIEELPAKPTV